MFWPLEGMPLALRYFANTLPFTLPAEAVRNIMAKGHHFTDSSVLIGFGVVLAWTAAGIVLGLKALQMKKYSRNT
jgi:ABC-type multidrug transport system permease subunit